MDIDLGLRGSEGSAAELVLYVWDEHNQAIELAHRDVPLGSSDWTHVDVAALVPAGHEHLGLFVYLKGGAGTRIDLDDAQLRGL